MERRAGNAVLRTRDDGAVELRVNGVFVMDDAETSSERLLAEATVATLPDPRRILVGGLGLGHTLRALLADDRIAHVRVAELEPAIAAWMREGVLPGADLLADPRVDLHLRDVREVVAAAEPSGFEAILLDVDNGPDFLVHESNRPLYEQSFLQRCADALAPGGQLCVWSMAESPALSGAMGGVFTRVDSVPVPVTLQGRDERYWLLRGHLGSASTLTGDNLTP